jgi:hypothetical protein
MLVKREYLGVELRGLEPLTPCLQTPPHAFGTMRDMVFSRSGDRIRPPWFGMVATGRSYRRRPWLGASHPSDWRRVNPCEERSRGPKGSRSDVLEARS